jgi:hypothetical protein
MRTQYYLWSRRILVISPRQLKPCRDPAAIYPFLVKKSNELKTSRIALSRNDA